MWIVPIWWEWKSFWYIFFFGYGKPSTYWCLLSGACLVKCYQTYKKKIQSIVNYSLNLYNFIFFLIQINLPTNCSKLLSVLSRLHINCCNAGVLWQPWYTQGLITRPIRKSSRNDIFINYHLTTVTGRLYFIVDTYVKSRENPEHYYWPD